MSQTSLTLKAVPLAVALALGGGLVAAQSNPCAPRTGRSPCGARSNPCAAKANPCAAKANPCAAKSNPCAARNPCAAKNPCGAAGKVDARLVTRPKGYKPAAGDVKLGERLWNDPKLSTNNLSCNTCHTGGAAFLPTFAKPYPHAVAMAKEQGGVKSVHLDEMVQFCLVVPMATKPLAWDSKELAALTAYTAVVQKNFIKTGAKNPCAAKANPCAAKNPCGARANPCAAKANPCAARNPCAAKGK